MVRWQRGYAGASKPLVDGFDSYTDHKKNKIWKNKLARKLIILALNNS